MIRLGVIGYGYWGPNIVRNFNIAEGSRVGCICDMNQKSLKKALKLYPAVKVTSDYKELIRDPDIDAVAIATPVFTHFALAKMALEEGKSVFIEKPFTYTSAEAEELIELAGKKNLKIMVDHTFLYTPAVKKIKQFVDDKVLGDIYYYDSVRVNLGLFQHDVNVVWDLAPHDLSVMEYILDDKPEAVIATGAAHFNRKLEDLAYLTFYFKGNIIAHISVNWLSPIKVRTTMIGGRKKMLVWNDLEPDEKIKIYDKGVQVNTEEGQYNLLVSYRSGDMWAPRIEQSEALKLLADSFNNYIIHGKEVINDGAAGLRVVRMLEASSESLKNKGKMVHL
jgi:predicted dehydrogenase